MHNAIARNARTNWERRRDRDRKNNRYGNQSVRSGWIQLSDVVCIYIYHGRRRNQIHFRPRGELPSRTRAMCKDKRRHRSSHVCAGQILARRQLCWAAGLRDPTGQVVSSIATAHASEQTLPVNISGTAGTRTPPPVTGTSDVRVAILHASLQQVCSRFVAVCRTDEIHAYQILLGILTGGIFCCAFRILLAIASWGMICGIGSTVNKATKFVINLKKYEFNTSWKLYSHVNSAYYVLTQFCLRFSLLCFAHTLSTVYILSLLVTLLFYFSFALTH